MRVTKYLKEFLFLKNGMMMKPENKDNFNV